MAIQSNLAGVARVAFEAETGEFNRDITQAEQRYKQATEHMSDSSIRLELAQNRLHRALAKGPGNYQAIARAELAVRREQDALSRSVNKSTASMDREERSLGRLTRGMIVGSGAAGRFGRSVAFASSSFLGGAGFAYALKSTLDVAGQFQRSLNVMQVVTHATAAEMGRASEEAKRLGRDITLPATSAKDAGDAMTELGKAGLNVQQSIAGAEGVLRLAAAAGIEVGDAAKITARSLNAFSLSGESASKVADVFAATANAASGEIPDVALAMQQASNVAHSWGLSLEQTAAMLGLLANKSIIGSDAGTSLRVMLTRLIPISKAAADKMNELGLSATDSAGNIKPLRQILKEYHDRLVTLAPAEQKLAVQTIFGQDAQRAVFATILGGLPAYDRMLKKVSELDAAQKNAAARNKGYSGALDAFKSSIETLQITIGTALLPQFTEALRAATNWVNKMESSGEATEQAKTAIHDAAVALKILKEVFGGIKAVLDPVIEAVGGLTHALEIAIGARFIYKILRSFGILATSSSAAATKGAADALRFEAAWDAATRNRTMVVTTVTEGVPGGGGGGGGRGRGTPTPVPTGRRGRIPTISGRGLVGGLIAGAGAAVVINETLGGVMGPPPLRQQQLNIADMSRVDPKRARELAREYNRKWGTPMGQLTSGNPLLMSQGDYQAVVGRQKLPTEIVAPGEGRPIPGPVPGKKPPRRRTGSGAGGDGLSPLDRAEIAAANAGTPQQELAAERQILAIYERELKTGHLTGEKLKDLRIKIGNQRQTVRGIEEGIERDAEQERDERKRRQKERADARKARYRERIDTAEQELRNLFDEALERPGRAGDRRRYLALRKFLMARVNDARLTAKEQADAQKRINLLDKQWVASRKAETKNELEAREEVLQNNVAAAELTEKNEKDDIKAHRRLRDFYKRQEHNRKLDAAARQEFRGKRIAEQKEINQLLKGDDAKRDAETIRRETEAAFSDFAGFQHQFLTGMISQFLGGTGSGNALQTHALEQFTLQGNAHLAEQTRYLRVMAGRHRRELDEALMP